MLKIETKQHRDNLESIKEGLPSLTVSKENCGKKLEKWANIDEISNFKFKKIEKMSDTILSFFTNVP